MCVFSTLHLRLFKYFGREEEEGKKMTVFGFWVGNGLVQMSKGDTVEEGPFPPLLLGILVAAACLFFFDSFLWPCTHMDSLSHPLFINLPIAIICGFWIPNLSSSIYTYIFAIIVIMYIKLLTNPVMYLIMVMDQK